MGREMLTSAATAMYHLVDVYLDIVNLECSLLQLDTSDIFHPEIEIEMYLVLEL